MVLSDTLADRCMARRQQVRWKGCFTFTYLWLATSWFVSGGCACYLSFRFFVSGRERESQARRRRRCGKTSSIQADKQRMPLKMKAACKHMLARQQATMSDNRKTKTQVKNTDEYRSKNRWMEIDIEQRGALEEANQNKTDAETFLQQTQDQSQRRLILSYVFFQILLGARRGRIGQGNAF